MGPAGQGQFASRHALDYSGCDAAQSGDPLAAMSVRNWPPSSSMRLERLVGARRGPRRSRRRVATTLSTRPPVASDAAPASSRRGAPRARSCTPCDGGGRIQAGDGAARDRDLGVALAGEHHGDGRVVRELGTRQPAEPAGGRREQQPTAASSAGQHDLGLGVAEARVELDHPDAAGRRSSDEAAVEQPDERGALGARAARDGRAARRVSMHLVDERRLVAERPSATAAASRRPCRRCSGPASPSRRRL